MATQNTAWARNIKNNHNNENKTHTTATPKTETKNNAQRKKSCEDHSNNLTNKKEDNRTMFKGKDA